MKIKIKKKLLKESALVYVYAKKSGQEIYAEVQSYITTTVEKIKSDKKNKKKTAQSAINYLHHVEEAVKRKMNIFKQYQNVSSGLEDQRKAAEEPMDDLMFNPYAYEKKDSEEREYQRTLQRVKELETQASKNKVNLENPDELAILEGLLEHVQKWTKVFTKMMQEKDSFFKKIGKMFGLEESSSMGAGAVQGHVDNRKKELDEMYSSAAIMGSGGGGFPKERSPEGHKRYVRIRFKRQGLQNFKPNRYFRSKDQQLGEKKDKKGASKSYCESTPCKDMGFTQKASCKSQGIKDCYRGKKIKIIIRKNLGERCQKGYKTHPTRKTKKMFGKTYRNCVKAEGIKNLEEVNLGEEYVEFIEDPQRLPELIAAINYEFRFNKHNDGVRRNDYKFKKRVQMVENLYYFIYPRKNHDIYNYASRWFEEFKKTYKEFGYIATGLIEGKDPKKGTGKKPKGSGRRLYTDENPSDTVSVKFSTVQDIKDTFSKASFKSKSHKRQSQIINLVHQRVRAAYQNAKDPDVKKRLKKAFDYAKKRKEASKRKTQRMKKNK